MNQTLTKLFIPCNPNQAKQKNLLQKAFNLRLYKNHISMILHQYILEHQELPGLFDIITQETKITIPYLINKDMEYAIKQVYTNYQNKIQGIKSDFTLKRVKFIKYKKSSKIYKKGDIKEIKTTKHRTELTKILTYMLKFDLPLKEWYQYIDTVCSKTKNKEIKNFFLSIKTKLDKYSQRLLKLIKARQSRLIKRYWQNRIHISSFSFMTQSRIKKDIIGKNKNSSSVIKGFISLGAYGRKSLDIPVKLHSGYHFDSNKRIQKITSQSFQEFSKVYTVVFKEDRFDHINLTKEVEITQDFSKNTNAVGIDTNVKHNLFALSNGSGYSLDKQVLKEYIDFLKYYDSKYGLIVNKVKTKETENLKNRKKNMQNKLTYEILKTLSDMIYDLKEQKINHLVMEDLALVGLKFRVKNKEYEIGYGRMFSFLSMNTLKDKIREICHKKGISVSFVPPHYTSQKCSECGYISSANRKTQEHFCCVECGFEINADTNSAFNILKVFLSNVLKKKFLEFDTFFHEFNAKRYLNKKTILATYRELYVSDTQL